MARVLAISSQVVRGHVGLGAAVPALNRLGHEAWALPTILLSNHPGHAVFAGERVDVGLLARLRDALRDNGWLKDVDAVLTGYLPSAAHVAFAVDTISHLRRRPSPPLVIVDPIIGDFPKGVYLEAAAAASIRNDLIPLADIITPNAFELGWLAQRTITSVADAILGARSVGHADAIVTSVPGSVQGRLANVRISEDGVSSAEVEERASVPRGTGDLFAALLLGHLLNGDTRPLAMARSAAGVETVLAASSARDELNLFGTHGSATVDWAQAIPLPLTAIGHTGADPPAS